MNKKTTTKKFLRWIGLNKKKNKREKKYMGLVRQKGKKFMRMCWVEGEGKEETSEIGWV